MTQAIELPDDVFKRLNEYGRTLGVTPAEAVFQLLEELGDESFSEVEAQQLREARAEYERGEVEDGPAFFTALRNANSGEK
ncbi:hypothetical protein [Deinococcus arenicola]|uniref:Antitoxin n=1 Tax=Deinococcus arenicola TaxID=2994950 RepID=A0ABU4DRI9_9DEIO|nr:hypothetical protein [Deinococcus sp. ZS9-10]MDV6374480.1 hypothetical protein [Deinococcus sp. ZS9-10]